MSFQIILNPLEESKILKEWDRFVLDLPQGNIFQTSYMYRVFAHTKNYEPLALLLLDENKSIKASLLAVKQNFGSKVTRSFSSRSLILGGPLSLNHSATLIAKLFEKYESLIKNRAIFTEVRNLTEMNNQIGLFAQNGYIFQDHLNIFIDLTLSEDQLWKKITSKRRNEIRRASRAGVIFSEIESEEERRGCYIILREVYKKAKLPLPDFSFFSSAFSFSNDSMGLKVFGAKYESKIIGTIFTLYFRDMIYDYYAGSLQQYYNKYPNDLIPWELFRWAKNHGYKFFDFGGAGKPDVPYGVRDYKKQFGGELVNLGRFRKIHRPLKMRMAEIGFKYWQYLKSI